MQALVSKLFVHFSVEFHTLSIAFNVNDAVLAAAGIKLRLVRCTVC